MLSHNQKKMFDYCLGLQFKKRENIENLNFNFFQENFVGIISRRLFETLAFRMEKLKIIRKNWHNSNF